MSFKYSFILSRKVSSKPSAEDADKITRELAVLVAGHVNPHWKLSIDPASISEKENQYSVQRMCHFTYVPNKNAENAESEVEKEVNPEEEKVKLVDKLCRFTADKSFSFLHKTEFGNFPLKNIRENNEDSVRRLSVDNRGDYFSHLYDRDHQIKMVLSAIKAGIDSNFENRFHCVLYGEPACGKSEILTSVAKMLGNEGEAYFKLDATSTTMAGAQKLFFDTSFKIPNILIIEEIEKQKEDHFRWLLGLLDHRAEIRKTTAKETYQRSAKVLCLATVNNMDKFERQMEGALYSRFANKIYCPRPDRSVLKKILTRELKKSNGNLAWIEPALDFCVDKMGWNDPREILPVCLQGQDSLLDGSYQASVMATQCPGTTKKSTARKAA